MRNESLLSLAALATVPVVSYADAPVSGLSDVASTLVTGKKGVPTTVELGTFAPGKYTVVPGTATEKTTFKVNGGEAGELTVELEQKGTITVVVENAEADYEVAGFKLTHVYDYESKHDALMNQVTAILGRLNTAKENDKNGALGDKATELQTKLSKLMGQINKLVDDKDGAYDAYKELKLYNEPSDIDKAITDAEAMVSQFEKDVLAADANAAVYAIEKGNAATAKANAAKLKYWKTEGSYATVHNKLDAIDAAIKDAREAIDAAVEAGTIESFDVDAEVEKIQAAVGAANTAIATAQADDEAYDTLVANAVDATANYTAASKAIQNQINGEEVYDDTYAAALAELRVQINVIKAVQEAIGTDANHEGLAVDAKDKENPGKTVAEIQQAKLDGANTEISNIQKKYVDDIKTMQDAYTAANTKLKTLNKNLKAIKVENIGDDTFNGKTIKDYVDEINAEITQLESDIKAANENHTIAVNTVHNVTTAFDVDTPAAEIQTLIDTLKGYADKANNNYEANVAVGKLQTNFNEAKTAVNALASGDYKAAGRYANTEDGIQKEIDAITESVTKAIEAGEQVVATWETTVENIEAKVEAYQTAAETALANYNHIVEAIDNSNKLVTELEGKGWTLSVGYNGTTVTYADKIKELKDAITAVDTNRKNAIVNRVDGDDIKDENDNVIGTVDHVSALATIAGTLESVGKVDKDGNPVLDENDQPTYNYYVKKSIYDELTEKDRYENDLANYNTQIVLNTATSTLAETWARYEALELPDPYDKKTYGNAADDLNTELETVKAAKDEISLDAKGTVYTDVENATAAIANLAVVQEELKKVQTALDALVENANKAKDAFDKNNTAYDGLLGKKGSLTTAESSLAKLPKNNETGEVEVKEDNTTIKYNKTATDAETEALKTTITNLKTAIETSKTAETVVADREDTTDKDGNVTAKGFDTQISELNTAIANLKAKIEKANANKKAHDAVLADTNYKDKGETAVGDLKTKLAAIKDLDGDGKDYYDNLVVEYIKSWDALVADIKKQWLALNSVIKQTEEKDQLKSYTEKIAAVQTNAKNDAAANKALVKRIKEVQDIYDAAYLKVSSEDESSQLQDNLDTLAGYQNELNKIEKARADAYKSGTSRDIKSEKLTALESLVLKIQDVQDYIGTDKYTQQIASDNTECYANFLTEVAKTEEAYRKAVQLILELQNVKTVDLAELLADANNNIYTNYAQKILNLKEKAKTEKDDTTAPDVYDSERKNIKAAADMTAEIKAAADALQAEADKLAKEWVESKYNAASDAYDDAVKAIAAAVEGEDVLDDKGNVTQDASDVKKETAENALQDVKTIIGDVKTNKEKTSGYAQLVDTDADNLATVDGKITDAKDAAAKADFAALLSKAQEQYKDWKSSLNDYTFDADEKTSDAIKENALEELADEYTEVKKVADKTATFDTLQDLKDTLKNFLNSTTYKEYTDKAINSPANLEALKAMQKALDEAKGKFTTAKAFNDQFVACNKVGSVETIQSYLAADQAEIDGYQEKGGAAAKQTTFITRVESYDIKGIYGNVLAAEYLYLLNQYDVLKAKYNEAVAAGALDDDKKQELLTAIEAIKPNVNAVNTKWIEAGKVKDNPETEADEAAEAIVEGRKAAATSYLALETEIGELLTEISNLANEQATATAYAELQESIKKWKAELDSPEEGDWHERTTTEFKDEVAEVKAAFDAIAAEIDEKNEAKLLLLHKANLEKAIADEGKVLDALYKEMGDEDAIFKANDAAYERLTGELDAAKKAIDDFEASLEGYGHVAAIYEGDAPDVEGDGEYGKAIAKVLNAIEDDRVWIDEKNDTGKGLNASSKVSDTVSGAVDEFAKLTIKAAREEAEEDGELVKYMKSYVSTLINCYVTGNVDKRNLVNKVTTISDKYDNANNYFDALTEYQDHAEDVYCDINGNEYEEPQDIEDLKVEFNDVSKVMDNLYEELNDIDVNIWNYYFTKGDLNQDYKISVLDYTALLNIVLGKTEMPEKGTGLFVAADTNVDDAINVGDLQWIKREIRGLNKTANKAPRKYNGAAESTDAVTVVADGNKLYIGLNNAIQYTSLQMDIKLPSSMIIMDETLTARAEGLSIASNEVDGMYRIVLHSIEDGGIQTGNGEVIVLTLSDNVNNANVRVENAYGSDADCRAYAIQGVGEATAIENIMNGLNSVKESVYDLGGRLMNGIHKGVNIIRGNNSSKKIVSK